MLLRQTAHQANHRCMGGLQHISLGDFLRSARDHRPLQFLVQVTCLQQGLDDAENEQQSLFLFSDDPFAAVGSIVVLADMLLFGWLVYRCERESADERKAIMPAE